MKSIMRVLSIIVSIVFFVNLISYSQEAETVSAGVINFLLSNPTTASRTNESEAAALRVIRDLLNISAQRKHEMNVGEAGKSEFIINTAAGDQAKIYLDDQDNIYLFYDGKIHPISSGLVTQARNEGSVVMNRNYTLPNYNLDALENEYKFEKTYKIGHYFLREKKETLDEISEENSIPIENIYIVYYSSVMKSYNVPPAIYTNLTAPEWCGFYRSAKLKKKGIMFCKAIPKEGEKRDNRRYSIRFDHSKYQFEIVTTFTCNWIKDFDGQGLTFDDFQGIKRSFYEDEKMLFVMGYTTEFEGTWVLEIHEALTGQTVYKKNGIMDKEHHVIAVEKEGEKLFPGVYIYYFNLVSESERNISKSERFEIIRSEEEK